MSHAARLTGDGSPNGLDGLPYGLDGSPNGPDGPPNGPDGPTVVPNQRMDNVTPICAIWDHTVKGLKYFGFCVNLGLCKSGFV